MTHGALWRGRSRLRSRRVLAALTLAILLVASAAVGATLVQRAHAASLSVCLSGACTYHSINDALAHAGAGDTINVAAGTYTPAAETTAGATTDDHVINVNLPVSILGAGAGSTILNVASAYAGTGSGSGIVRIINPGGNVTFSGFTVEGTGANAAYAEMVQVNDTNSGDLITIRQDVFHQDSTLDPGLLADQVDAIYVFDGNATVDVFNNTFEGIFRAMLVEGNLGPLHFQGNLLNNLHGLFDTPSPSSPLDFGVEGVFFLADNFANSTAIQDVSGNTFQNMAGMAIGADAGYPDGVVGAVNNLAITNNTFNVEGVNTVFQGETSTLYFRGFAPTDPVSPPFPSLINGVTIEHNTLNLSSNGTGGHGHAIRFRGGIGLHNSVNHNTFTGGGSTVPLDGVEFDTTTNNDDVRLTNNVIKGFQNGIHSDALPGGAAVVAHQNCIAGNTVFGATNDPSGASINAQSNWWGAATGPNTAGADNASSNIDTTNFLTTPAGICAAPSSSLVTVTGADVTPSGAWSYADTRNAGTGTFVLGAATPPYGVGSFKLVTPNSADKAQLMTNAYSGTLLSSIDGVSYETYRDPAATGFSAGVAGLNIRVFFDSSNPASYRYMVYEPYQDQGNSAVLTGTWQTWDAYRGGQAKWWITGTFGNSAGCGQSTPCTWAHILSLFPNATILDGLDFKGSVGVNQGSSNTGFSTNVDALSVSVMGHETIYNFEPQQPSASLTVGAPTYTAGPTTYITSASSLTVMGAESSGTIASVSYRICPTNCSGNPAYTTTAGSTASFTVSGADGVYEVDDYATDGLGQQSAPQAKMLTLDNTAPASTIAIGQPQSTSGSVTYVGVSTPFTVSATDGGSGVATVSYRFFPKNGTAPAFTVASGSTATFTLSGAFGEYEVDYDAADHLGNDPVHTIFVTLTDITPGEDVAGNPGSGSSGGAQQGGQPGTDASAHVPVGISQSNNPAQVRLPRLSHAGRSTATGQRGWLMALWILLALVVVAGAGGAGYYVYRQRRAAQG